jgi:hypothetical protein
MTSFLLQGTVLLNANISFLEVGTFHSSGAVQVASYMSTLASIGSIISGLLLLRQTKTSDKNTAVATVSGSISCWTCTLLRIRKRDYLYSFRHPTRGLEILAIVYGLPYALVMWG